MPGSWGAARVEFSGFEFCVVAIWVCSLPSDRLIPAPSSLPVLCDLLLSLSPHGLFSWLPMPLKPPFRSFRKRPGAPLQEGLADFRIQKFKDAKAEFQKMTDLAPDHPMGWVNLGSAEFRLGEVAEAEEHLKKAVRLDPTAQQAWLTLGIIDYQKDALDAGLAALSQAVYLDPRDPKAHLYLGILIRKRGWLAAAEDEMRKAIELDEKYAEAHFNLAVLYLEHQPPAVELARRHYYRALKLGAEPDAELDRALKKPDAGEDAGAPTN